MLYGHPESGHTYKVALALSVAGIRYEYRQVDIFSPPDARRADFRAVSLFSEVPVLIDNGTPLVQSNAILLHVARRYRCLGGETEESYSRSREWLFWEANRVGFSLPNLRHLVRYEKDPPPAVLSWLKDRFVLDAKRLDNELTFKSFLLGEVITVADIACCSYLWSAHEAGIDLGVWPAVVNWLGRIRALPGWQPPHELLRQR